MNICLDPAGSYQYFHGFESIFDMPRKYRSLSLKLYNKITYEKGLFQSTIFSDVFALGSFAAYLNKEN
jgi:hypothetical protein